MPTCTTCKFTSSRVKPVTTERGANTAPTGLTTRTRPTSTRRALPSPSVLSSSSTPRRSSAPSSPTLPRPAATARRFSASSTHSKPATRTRSPPLSTGFPVTTSLSTPASRVRKLPSSSPTCAPSSLTSASLLCPTLLRCYRRAGLARRVMDLRGCQRTVGVFIAMACLFSLQVCSSEYPARRWTARRNREARWHVKRQMPMRPSL